MKMTRDERLEDRAASSANSGPQRSACAVCAREIDAYETRQYGRTGAAHLNCVTDALGDVYPHLYSDG